ncbi:hypothetical protein PC121_g18905, partial [Phytophthora cactorum]
MASRKPVMAAAIAGIIAAGLTSAGVPVAVYHDATYSLSESCGIPCSGVGVEPVGTACPKTGDVATADCQPYLLSYNGAVCVAPVDAECVLGHDDVWHCEFPKTGYTSAVEAETIAGYDGESSGWGAGHDEGVHVGDEAEDTPAGVNYDTTLDKPLGIICDVAPETTTQGHATEGGKHYGSTGNTKSTTGGKTTVDYSTPSTETNIDETTIHYGSSTDEGVTRGGYGPADARVIDATPHVDLTGTTETTEGGTTSEGGTTTGGYTTESTTHGNTEGATTTGNNGATSTTEGGKKYPAKTTVEYPTGASEGTEGQHATVNYEGAYEESGNTVDNETTSESGDEEYSSDTSKPGTKKPCKENGAHTYKTTYAPTEQTTYAPTEETTYAPTEETTYAPTEETTYAPTEETTYAPTEETTYAPTEETTYAPTEETTYAPTEETTYAPTEETTYAPTEETTYAPTEETT